MARIKRNVWLFTFLGVGACYLLFSKELQTSALDILQKLKVKAVSEEDYIQENPVFQRKLFSYKDDVLKFSPSSGSSTDRSEEISRSLLKEKGVRNLKRSKRETRRRKKFAWELFVNASKHGDAFLVPKSPDVKESFPSNPEYLDMEVHLKGAGPDGSYKKLHEAWESLGSVMDKLYGEDLDELNKKHSVSVIINTEPTDSGAKESLEVIKNEQTDSNNSTSFKVTDKKLDEMNILNKSLEETEKSREPKLFFGLLNFGGNDENPSLGEGSGMVFEDTDIKNGSKTTENENVISLENLDSTNVPSFTGSPSEILELESNRSEILELKLNESAVVSVREPKLFFGLLNFGGNDENPSLEEGSGMVFEDTDIKNGSKATENASVISLENLDSTKVPSFTGSPSEIFEFESNGSEILKLKLNESTEVSVGELSKDGDSDISTKIVEVADTSSIKFDIPSGVTSTVAPESSLSSDQLKDFCINLLSKVQKSPNSKDELSNFTGSSNSITTEVVRSPVVQTVRPEVSTEMTTKSSNQELGFIASLLHRLTGGRFRQISVDETVKLDSVTNPNIPSNNVINTQDSLASEESTVSTESNIEAQNLITVQDEDLLTVANCRNFFQRMQRDAVFSKPNLLDILNNPMLLSNDPSEFNITEIRDETEELGKKKVGSDPTEPITMVDNLFPMFTNTFEDIDPPKTENTEGKISEKLPIITKSSTEMKDKIFEDAIEQNVTMLVNDVGSLAIKDNSWNDIFNESNKQNLMEENKNMSVESQTTEMKHKVFEGVIQEKLTTFGSNINSFDIQENSWNGTLKLNAQNLMAEKKNLTIPISENLFPHELTTATNDRLTEIVLGNENGIITDKSLESSTEKGRIFGDLLNFGSGEREIKDFDSSIHDTKVVLGDDRSTEVIMGQENDALTDKFLESSTEAGRIFGDFLNFGSGEREIKDLDSSTIHETEVVLGDDGSTEVVLGDDGLTNMSIESSTETGRIFGDLLNFGSGEREMKDLDFSTIHDNFERNGSFLDSLDIGSGERLDELSVDDQETTTSFSTDETKPFGHILGFESDNQERETRESTTADFSPKNQFMNQFMNRVHEISALIQTTWKPQSDELSHVKSQTENQFIDIKEFEIKSEQKTAASLEDILGDRNDHRSLDVLNIFGSGDGRVLSETSTIPDCKNCSSDSEEPLSFDDSEHKSNHSQTNLETPLTFLPLLDKTESSTSIADETSSNKEASSSSESRQNIPEFSSDSSEVQSSSKTESVLQNEDPIRNVTFESLEHVEEDCDENQDATEPFSLRPHTEVTTIWKDESRIFFDGSGAGNLFGTDNSTINLIQETESRPRPPPQSRRRARLDDSSEMPGPQNVRDHIPEDKQPTTLIRSENTSSSLNATQSDLNDQSNNVSSEDNIGKIDISTKLVSTDSKPDEFDGLLVEMFDKNVPNIDIDEINLDGVVVATIKTSSTSSFDRPRVTATESSRRFCSSASECEILLNERCISVKGRGICDCGRSFVRHPKSKKCEAPVVLKTSLKLPGEEFHQDLKDKSSDLFQKKRHDSVETIMVFLGEDLRSTVADVDVVGFEQGSLIISWELTLVPEGNASVSELIRQVDSNLEVAFKDEELLKKVPLNAENALMLSESSDVNQCEKKELNYCSIGADCLPDEVRGFRCRCKEGYLDNSKNLLYPGEICIEVCPPNFCGENGFCELKQNGSRQCLCNGWYFGSRCEISGIVVISSFAGVNVFIIIVVLVIVCCLRRRRRRRWYYGNNQILFQNPQEFGQFDRISPLPSGAVALDNLGPTKASKYMAINTPKFMKPDIKITSASIEGSSSSYDFDSTFDRTPSGEARTSSIYTNC